MDLSVKIIQEAQALQEEMVSYRRHFHENPEVHLDLPMTKKYVQEKLIEFGYEPIECGQSGLICLVGKGETDKCFLIRADMDALPIVEETDLEYKSTNKNMHACGHDMHTAMLLGAAKILKAHEDEIQGVVKLMFQPAEETLCGAKEMIENGLLENPNVDVGLMIHVTPSLPLPTGAVVTMPEGICSTSSDWFEIHIQGKGGHGAMPQTTIDPLNVAAHTLINLQAIISREINGDGSVLTIGMMKGGETANVIPSTAMLQGTLRAFDPEIREFIKGRIVEVSQKTAELFRAKAEVKFTFGCPSVSVDKDIKASSFKYLSELLGKGVIDASLLGGNAKMAGSEDFGYITEKIPGVLIGLAAGNPADGYVYPPHHPKVLFDEAALQYGAAAYAYTAIRWLMDNK